MPTRLYPLILIAIGAAGTALLYRTAQMAVVGILFIATGCALLLWRMVRRPVRDGPVAHASGAPASRPAGVTDELTRLGSLRDRGMLTKTEFESLRRKLVG